MKKFFIYTLLLLFSTTMMAAKYSQVTRIQTGGKWREAFIYVPDGMKENRPLVIAAHGMGDNIDNLKASAQWELVADTANFAVVYPQGDGSQWDINGMTDINFMLDIIKKMSEDYKIDESRVYMTGFSMGGMLTYHIINNVADKFAAFGPISGYNLWGEKFNCSRPVPICHVHGQEDSFVDYNGVPAIIKGFANKDNCNPTPEVTQVSNICTKTRYKDGDCGTEVVLYSVKNRWHELKNNDFHTTKALWDFFRNYTNKCDEKKKQDIDKSACEEAAKKNIYEVECSSDYSGTTESLSKMSGTGVINLKETTDYVNINIPITEKGSYKVYVGYNSVYGFKQINCSVNGVSGTANLGVSSDDDKIDKLGETLVGTFNFSAGKNVVNLTPIWTWAVVDYVRIEKDNDAPSYNFKVSDVDGFKVDGAKLLDRCGNEFVMRGVNLAYTWFKSSAYNQLEAIKKYDANAVRIVLGDGAKFTADDAASVKKIVDKCKEYGMVAIVEVHDATGSDNIDDLVKAANYFANMASVLKGTEHYVIINIANEWHNSSSAANWRDGYKKAIPVIRKAGLRHCIMVDAGGYGQNASTIHTYGKDVLAADTENNILFSIHMYGSAGNTNKIASNIDGVINQDLALCIGEFGWFHSDGDVDEDKILSYCKEKNVGWLAWSWYGNGSPVEYLDVVKDPSANPVLASYSNLSISNWNNTQTWKGSSNWGKIITEAWKAEAKKATLNECPTTSYNEKISEESPNVYIDKNSELNFFLTDDTDVTITDICGRVILQKKLGKGIHKTNVSQWHNGLYLASIDGNVFKIIKK